MSASPSQKFSVRTSRQSYLLHTNNVQLRGLQKEAADERSIDVFVR